MGLNSKVGPEDDPSASGASGTEESEAPESKGGDRKSLAAHRATIHRESTPPDPRPFWKKMLSPINPDGDACSCCGCCSRTLTSASTCVVILNMMCILMKVALYCMMPIPGDGSRNLLKLYRQSYTCLLGPIFDPAAWPPWTEVPTCFVVLGLWAVDALASVIYILAVLFVSFGFKARILICNIFMWMSWVYLAPLLYFANFFVQSSLCLGAWMAWGALVLTLLVVAWWCAWSGFIAKAMRDLLKWAQENEKMAMLAVEEDAEEGGEGAAAEINNPV